MDLPNLDTVTGQDLTDDQIKGILAQIDLDITNLLRDGKLAAAKYTIGGEGGQHTDRAANLQTLLQARTIYQDLLTNRPVCILSQAQSC